MTNTAHTPTPWKADGTHICQNNNGHFHVIGEVKAWSDFDQIDFENKQSTEHGKKWLVDMSIPIEGTEEANAAFIVKAVNCHDALVTELKSLIDDFEFLAKETSAGDHIKIDRVNKAKAVLAAAEAQ